MKNIRVFYLKFSFFLVVKFSVYLNRHVFLMHFRPQSPCLDLIITFVCIPLISLAERAIKLLTSGTTLLVILAMCFFLKI